MGVGNIDPTVVVDMNQHDEAIQNEIFVAQEALKKAQRDAEPKAGQP